MKIREDRYMSGEEPRVGDVVEFTDVDSIVARMGDRFVVARVVDGNQIAASDWKGACLPYHVSLVSRQS